MDATLMPAQLLLLAFVVFLTIFPRHPGSFWRQLRGQLEHLGNELDRHVDRERWMRRLPVFSAETTRGKEAEFIREPLSRRSPRALFVIALLVVGVLVWWLTR